ncbi:hypothetical protein [Merismopedia glauca]|uniref:Uncharacterized protein n=1 Tax=Merismopedia glauca CCAP 1448/3 TaxID=1296344 RepID=A0A2T1C9R7_9CYAN|nr:hypothetical protein [Merismopedia glauca]PSB04996.1 hypothetical protein C7B64_01125 [Merismopedia glauca CCAP 1448/3]
MEIWLEEIWAEISASGWEFLTVAKETFSVIKRHKTQIISLLIILLVPLYLSLSTWEQGRINSQIDLALVLFVLVVALCCDALLYRLAILDSFQIEPYEWWDLLKLGGRLLLCYIKLAIIWLPTLLLTVIPLIGELLFFLVSGWFIGRFLLLFPTLAIGYDLSLKWSWNQTKNYQGLMFLIALFIPVTSAIFQLLIDSFVKTSNLAAFCQLTNIFICGSIQSILISRAYMKIRQEQQLLIQESGSGTSVR